MTTENPRAFLAIKFRNCASNKEQGEKLIGILQEAGLNVSCLVQEEEWGRRPREHPVKDAFELIETSNVLFVDASGETGFGMGTEVGYAKGRGKPVVFLCPKGAELKITRRDSADAIVEYEGTKDLLQQLKKLNLW